MSKAIVAMIKEKGAPMFAPYNLTPMDATVSDEAVIVPFGNSAGTINVCISGREVRMNAAPERMRDLVTSRLNNAYRTFQNNGGLRV